MIAAVVLKDPAFSVTSSSIIAPALDAEPIELVDLAVRVRAPTSPTGPLRADVAETRSGLDPNSTSSSTGAAAANGHGRGWSSDQAGRARPGWPAR